MFTMTDGLKRLVLAELVRQQLDAENEGVKAAQLVKVTGWAARDVDRYPGTSSHWVEHYVDIYWTDDAEDFQVYQWSGTEAELDRALERLVDDY